MVRAAQLIDYAEPSVAQRKHRRVGDGTPHYLLFVFVKNKVQLTQKAVAQRSRIGKMFA